MDKLTLTENLVISLHNNFCIYALMVVLVASCSNAFAAQSHRTKHLIPVPMTRQSTDYTCGAAALQSVMGYFGKDAREGEVATKCGTTVAEGTTYRRIAQFAKESGFSVEIHRNMSINQLRKLIDQGKPVVCLIQAWPERKVDYSTDWNDGHYVVAIGYDEKSMYFMDPSTLGNYTFIPNSEFLQRWHDRDTKEKLTHFGMVISKSNTSYNPLQFKKLE